MVTAELAVTLPALVLVAVTGFGVVGMATAQLRCADAAAVAARLAARGEPTDAVVAAARAAAPSGAAVTVRREGESVAVIVRAEMRLPGLGLRLPATKLSARFVAPVEPGQP